ncbi:Glycosyltransferase involved in cell wall bisynthesis [Halorubrum xinjiangense]|uniref:Glycosyltransferase involved in cell wall bisynthesis n=1 Tax=Halorubrum xinjiangense TaxID=261291 RepID=A0A1G7JN20_9EURY|nr:glycosyltransferase family 2 protein [Halorubrum xinjiangense]SDF26266.1 Glycosyltransferase involved in cell wall bisynthesis [Halorubrum xinjiangense]
MYRDHTVAVVVPAYNEAGFVGAVIDDLPAFVDRAYLVDDGSTDGTWAEIREHAERRNAAHDGEFDDLVVPIRHDENRGVGGAIKTGYKRARAEGIDVTAVLGGDDQMDPRVLTGYLDPIVEGVAGYAKGNRFARAEDWAEMPRFRLLGNVILSYLTKVASGYWETMDSQNGYTAVSLDALERTDIEGMYEYYGYCNDLLVRLNAADVVVADVPRSSEYAYSEGWKSHIDYTEYIPKVSLMLARAFWWRLRRKYLMTGYSPIAPLYLLGAVASGVGAAGVARSVFDRDADGGSWMTATLVGALTLLYATIRDQEANAHLEHRVGDDDGPAQAAASLDEAGNGADPEPHANGDFASVVDDAPGDGADGPTAVGGGPTDATESDEASSEASPAEGS